MGSYFVPPANHFFNDMFVSNVANISNVMFENGNVIAAQGTGYFIGNGAFITGVTSTAVANIPSVLSADIRGNIIGNYSNTTNVIASFANIGNVLFNAGNVTVPGNGFFIGNGSQLTGITAIATIPSTINTDVRGNIIGVYANMTNVIATFGNIGNVLFNAGNVTVPGNGFFIGNGSQLTGITATATIPSTINTDVRGNIIGVYANMTNVIATFGNIGNVLFNAGNVTVPGNGFFIGNGSQLTGITATATIPSTINTDVRGNIIGVYANMTNVIATFGNIGNVLFNAGNVTVPENGFFIGNGSQLTGITATATIPSTINTDVRGNIIGVYANMTNVIATFGNI
ncbi:Chlorovirus glycoprotein repeat domain-containing protein, partial [Paramecium bursaria Chlorella virus MA1D]